MWFPVFFVGLLALSAKVYYHCTSDYNIFSRQKVLGVDSACTACIALPGYVRS